MPLSSLHRRLNTLAAQPFYTHYAGDARIELSAVTFANWVDKTCNLLEDLGVEPTDVVQLSLATTHPGHWVSMVWVAACWQRGCTISLDEYPSAVLVVIGPGSESDGRLTVACSLHPLGLGFHTTPTGCSDYAEVLAQPDTHVAESVSPGDVAILPQTTFRNLQEVAPRRNRLLFADPPSGWATIKELLIAPLLGDGSTVVAVGADTKTLDRISAQERSELNASQRA